MSKTDNKNATTEEADVAFYKSLDIQAGTAPTIKSAMMEAILMDMPFGVFGKAGCGKTALAYQVAEELDMDIQVLYLAHMDKEDLAGFPFPDPNDSTAVLMRLKKQLPRERSKRKGTVLFLDEWNRGERPVVNAMFTIMEKPRRAGDLVLPDDVRVVLSGNPSDAQYAVNEAEKEPAIRRRVLWMGMITSAAPWLEHADRKQFHPAVVNYIRRHKEKLYDTEAHNAGRVGASPASWEKVSHIVRHFDKKYGNFGDKEFAKHEASMRALISGALGLKTAGDFMTELTNEDMQLVGPEEILSDFKPGSEAYEKVKKMVSSRSQGSSGKIGQLCEAVALTVATTKPTPLTTAPCVAEFMGLLQGDNFQKFAETLLKTLQEQDPEKEYTKLFNSALGKQPAYLDARKRHAAQMQKMESTQRK